MGRALRPMWSGVVEYVQREGYAEKYGVRPMRILRDAVSLEIAEERWPSSQRHR